MELAADHLVARISLSGSFRIELLGGHDVTPRSAKAQALLALLATNKNGERSRSWIQSKLWSDRGPEQAAGSLRQCLVQIRRSLGSEHRILNATRQKIALDLSLVDIDTSTDQEFLEGIDVRDNEFDNWLRDMRTGLLEAKAGTLVPAQGSSIPAQFQRKAVAIKTSSSGTSNSDQLLWMAETLADGVAQQMRETFSVDVVVGQNVEKHGRVWEVDISACALSQSKIGVRMSLSSVSSGERIWADKKTIECNGAPPTDHPDLMLLSNQLIEASADAFYVSGSKNDCPDTLCRDAIRTLFAMTPDAVARAEKMFSDAYDLQPRGLYLAWRAQAKTIQKAERHFDDVSALVAEGERLCLKAIEAEPNNSMVLATVANTLAHLMRQDERSLYMAKRSVLLNRSNPMAWWALSSANVYAGEVKKSFANALMARRLALTVLIDFGGTISSSALLWFRAAWTRPKN